MDAMFNNFAEPPGVYIQDELDARGWLQSDLAYILGVPATTVNQIIKGKRGISSEMAKALGEAFGTSAELFANLQMAWELEQAREPDPGIATRSALQSRYPLREMIKRGWIEDSRPEMLEFQLSSFFGVSKIGDAPYPTHAFKRVGDVNGDITAAQWVWLYRVRQIASQMVVPNFTSKRLKEACATLSDLRGESNEIRHVPRILSEAGIRFVIVEKLPGSKIDGVCTWLDAKTPVIGISTLHDRIDNFWFVLGHELAHVAHGHGKGTAIIDVDLDRPNQIVEEEEMIANREGAEFCVDQTKMESFFNRKKPYFYERDVIAFAIRMGVHTGIIVGQIQRRTEDWRFLRRHQVSVRETLLLNSAHDGWGHVAPV